MLFTNYLIIL